MSTLKQMKKAELQALAEEIGVSPDGVKQEIEDRIGEKLQSDPQRFGQDSRFATFYSPRKRAARKPKEDDEKHSVASSSVDPEADEDEADEDDDEEGEEDDGDEETAGEAAVNALQNWWLIVQDYAEDAWYSLLDLSELTQSKLSSVYVINFIGVLFEIVNILHVLLPIEANTLAPFQYFKVAPSFQRILKWDLFWQPYFTWLLWFVALPLVISHYINFKATSSSGHRRKSRSKGLTIIDPFVFALSKLLIAYLLFSGALAQFFSFNSSAEGWLKKTTPLIITAVGKIPYIAGGVGTLVALYVATL